MRAFRSPPPLSSEAISLPPASSRASLGSNSGCTLFNAMSTIWPAWPAKVQMGLAWVVDVTAWSNASTGAVMLASVSV